MMKETRPDWYNQAVNGPFEKEGFTNKHKQAVMMRVVQSRGPQAVNSKPRRIRKYIKWGLSFAFVLLIMAAGWLWNSNVLNTNLASRTQNILRDSPPEGISKAIWSTAITAMQEVVGKSMDFVDSQESENNEIYLSFRGEENEHASLWINKSTNKVTKVLSTAMLPKGSEAALAEIAELELKRLGYTGSFDYTVERQVSYGMWSDTDDSVLTIFKSDDQSVEFENGELYRLWMPKNIEDISIELITTATAGLKELRGDRQAPVLSRVFVTKDYSLGHEILDLQFKYGEEPAAAVYIDLRQNEIIQVSDWSLKGASHSSTIVTGVKNVKEEAAPLILKILDVNIADYQVTVDKKKPGQYKLVKKGEPSITIACSKKYVYSIQKEIFED